MFKLLLHSNKTFGYASLLSHYRVGDSCGKYSESSHESSQACRNLRHAVSVIFKLPSIDLLPGEDLCLVHGGF